MEWNIPLCIFNLVFRTSCRSYVLHLQLYYIAMPVSEISTPVSFRVMLKTLARLCIGISKDGPRQVCVHPSFI